MQSRAQILPSKAGAICPVTWVWWPCTGYISGWTAGRSYNHAQRACQLFGDDMMVRAG